jgi:hypothetical protein
MHGLRQNKTGTPPAKEFSMNENNIMSRRKALGGLGAIYVQLAASDVNVLDILASGRIDSGHNQN